ncbi:FAD-binding oxidoreductase [Mesorhizobium sp. BAC0120]|uniref:FAD-binding oxidoreductase n=1 Tax=Mesorhizobium sp. BAC0120 TaxID=3090670 RepID=UPI00298D0CC1|nr:FAD-binding oxidoreductase [Mesorhizobium sp. BAC0120]MDW6025863.1 FAD-binding oxidoreductase [Mesorhizobium sp. BAC0120]
MTNVSISTIGATPIVIPPEELDALRAGLRGSACTPTDPGYDEARTIWNAMIDRRPGLVIRCQGTADVIRAVELAKKYGLVVAVRGGGHNIAGSAVCEGGLLIDLSPMRWVRVDPEATRMNVGPGATLADVDREAQAFGLALPTGINSTTGIAGLTLGGGFGWLTRKFGMTIDNLISADVVRADGQLVKASVTDNADLFWALRGGGGNFGVVTNFEFKLHRVGPEVLSGLVVHPFADAKKILTAYQPLLSEAPDELTCWSVMRKAPPLPFLPAEWHGREVLILAMCWVGDMAAGEKAMAKLRGLGKPIVDVVSPHPFVGWQSAFDPLLTPGARNYWKTHDFDRLDEGLIDTLIKAVGELPGPECEVFVAHVGGAMSRVPIGATAYPQRDAHYTMNVHTRWREAREDAACIGWARDLFDEAGKYALGSAYVNFMPEDEGDRIEKVYGPNYHRLREVKWRYDPGNLFRANQNIRPMKT